ncbi:TolC family protein [Chitinophagaceae bacterium 26-R-25]|nr:TolC family protein [Chitinophagaceae bacterium 26-R-25]
MMSAVVILLSIGCVALFSSSKLMQRVCMSFALSSYVKKGAVVACTLLISGYSFSQNLTLDDAVNIALKNSLDIQLAKNNVTVNDINNFIGIAGGLPVVSGTATDAEQLSNINQKYADPKRDIQKRGVATNNLSGNVQASYLLFNGMRVVTTRKRLNELLTQSKEQLNSQVQNIMASVMTAYYDVIRQQNYIKTIDQSLIVSQQKLDIVKTQQAVGMANNADLFQAQVDYNTLVQSHQSQQLAIDQSKTELLRLLTLKADSVISISDTILVDHSLVLGTILDNLPNNPDLRAAEDQVRINQFIVKETAAQRYPSLRLNGGYSFVYNSSAAGDTRLNNSYGPTIGVGVGVPIYNGSIYKRQQKIAEVNVNSAELTKDIIVRDYSANIIKTYQAYTSTLMQLETQRKNYELSKQLVDLILQKFQLHQATIIDVRTAQQSFELAGYSLINLSFSAKSSEIELKRVSSQLKP